VSWLGSHLKKLLTRDSDEMSGNPQDSDLELAILAAIAQPNLYQENGFRASGLRVNAEVKGRLDKLDRDVQLGRTTKSTEGALALGLQLDASRLNQVKERLRDPEKKLIDEFFWFWPSATEKDDLAFVALENSDIDSAEQIWKAMESARNSSEIASHNLAILYHAVALDLEIASRSRKLSTEEEECRESFWRASFQQWSRLIDSEPLWSHFTARIREIDNPLISTGVVRRIRSELPHLLIMINARMALAALERDERKEAERQMSLIRQSRLAPDIIDCALRSTVRHYSERITHLCQDAIARSKADPPGAKQAIRELLRQANPLLEAIDCLLSSKDEMRIGAHDRVVDSAVDSIDFFINGTKDWIVALDLLNSITVSTVSKSVRTQYNDDLQRISEGASNQFQKQAKQAAQEQNEAQNRARRKREEENRALENVESRINVVLSSRVSAKAKYQQLRNNVVPLLESIKLERGEISRIFIRASNSLSLVLKNLARELYEVKDVTLAREAVELALTICRDEQLKATINREGALIKESLFISPIKDLCHRAKAMAADHPESADQSARWLVNNSRPLLSEMKKVASTSSLAEIHDEVVLSALSCHNMYGQATGDVQGCLEIVELILPLAASQTVRSKVAEQIDFAHWYLDHAKSSKATEQPAVIRTPLREETKAAKTQKPPIDSLHESEPPKRAKPFKVSYSESSGIKTLAAQIGSIMNAPGPAQQNFFSLVDNILPLVKEINQVCGEDSASARAASELATKALWDISDELFREMPTRQFAYEALRLAAEVCSDPNIRKHIETERVMLERYAIEPNVLTYALSDVAHPRALKAMAGTGSALAGASDQNSKGGSYLTNLYLTVLFLPLLPVARYRVIKRKDGTVRFMGKAKLRRIDHLHTLFVIAALLGLLVAVLYLYFR